MRRWASIVLFVIGGFCVGMQVMIAFMHIPLSYGGKLPPIVEFTAIAVPFLAAGTWLSPGRRWRELGMTMLIGAAVCVGSFAITLAAPVDEGGVGGIGPLTGYVDWRQGWVNVAIITIAGVALLFIDRPPRAEPAAVAGPQMEIERGEIMKGNAPWPVTVVAVVIIIAAFATFGALWSGSEQGKALAALATSSYESSWLPWAGVAVAIGCGVGIVLGWPMARLLFVAWMGWGVIEGLFWLEERHFNLGVTLVYAAIAVLLFLPASNAWFRSDRAAEA
jgi:hypothetical protein